MIQLGKNPLSKVTVDPTRQIFDKIRHKLPNGAVSDYLEWLLTDHQNHLRGRVFADGFDAFATFDEGRTFYQLVLNYDKLDSIDPIIPQVAQLPDSKEYKLWLTETTPTTCPICLEHQGMIVDTFMVGLGVEPPLHPHCNCKLVPMKCMLEGDWLYYDFDSGVEFAEESEEHKSEAKVDSYEDLELTEEEKILVGTIAGEALSLTPDEWRACASVVMNRQHHSEWKNKSVTKIATASAQFTGYNPNESNSLYSKARRVLDNSSLSTDEQININAIKKLAPVVVDVYRSGVDYAEGAVFFSHGRPNPDSIEVLRGRGFHHRFFLHDKCNSTSC